MTDKTLFTSEYKDSAFYAWYKSGRPKLTSVVRVLPVSDSGKKPSLNTVIEWMHGEGWVERADALDAEVSMRLDTEVIEARIEQLRKMAKLGEELMLDGHKYIKEEGFDSAAAAVRAIGLGGDMVYKYAAAADYMAKIGSMSNKQLETEIRKLLGKGEDEILDADAEDVDVDGTEDNNAGE